MSFQDISTIGETFVSILWYNIFATNNAKKVLGGNPFDNSERIYSGSKDPLFNLNADRYSADKKALDNINASYQTSGILVRPVVMLHSLRDPVVPNDQQRLYEEKAMLNSPEMLISYSPAEYGHCNFTKEQLLKAFYGLVYQVTGRMPLTKEEFLKRYRWLKASRI